MEYFILFLIYLFSSFGELISLVLLFLFLCPASPLSPQSKRLGSRSLWSRFELRGKCAGVAVWRGTIICGYDFDRIL